MSPEIQKGQEQGGEIPSSKSLEKSAHMARKEPKKVAEAIKMDPQLGVISGIWKGAKEGVVSSWDGTKAVFTGTGEFIGVGVAKLIHEGGDSFLQYAGEKTQVLGDVVHIAGEAIAVTAFEAVHGDQSVIQGALEYWKGKGVEFGKLPAGKQAELLTKFSTQIALGIIGTKGLSVASKTTTLSKTIDLTGSMNSKTGQAIGKMVEKTGSAVSMVGVEVAGLDSGAIKGHKRREKIVAESTEKTTRAEKVAKTEARSGVSYETVMKNASLSDTERLIEAEKILKKQGLLGKNANLSGIQKSEILASHNAGKGVYENTPSDLKEKIKAGKKAATEAGGDTRDMLTKKERRVLMAHGILGMDESQYLKQIIDGAKIKPASLEELRKTDSILAKQVDNYLLNSENALLFKTGTYGDDWADIILNSSKLKTLKDIKGKVSPEYFQSLEIKVHSDINTSLGLQIRNRLNGNATHIETQQISECFQKLRKQGFPIDPESLMSKDKYAEGINTALKDTLHRAEISTAGVSSKEKVMGICKDFSTERKVMITQLGSKDLTKDALEEIQSNLEKQSQSIREKLEDLQKLENNLGTLKNTNGQEIDAKKKVNEAIKLLKDESTAIDRIKNGSEITAVGKRIELKIAAEKEAVIMKPSAEIIDMRTNKPVHTPSNEKAALALLEPHGQQIYNMLSDPTALISRRADITTVFDIYLPKIASEELRQKFTPEILAKFGRNPDFTKIID